MSQLPLLVPTEAGEQPAVRYPWGPAARNTDTSQAAADAIAPRDDTLKRMVLGILRDAPDGLTADEAASALKQNILAIRPRVTELYRLGYIGPTADRRKNASGKSAIVWRVLNVSPV